MCWRVPLLVAEIAPLLDDPPVSFSLDGEDTELAAAIDRAAPGVLRQAAATAARHAVQLARLDQDPVVMEALAAAEAGQARPVDDHSPLGWRIRTWAREVRIAERVRRDPSASLEAQQTADSRERRTCSALPGWPASFGRSRTCPPGWVPAGRR
jgi:hypothetical protein